MYRVIGRQVALTSVLLLLLKAAISKEALYWKYYPLDASLYPLAQCLDGTMGGYWYLEGTVKDKIVVHQQGGGWCLSDEACYQRGATSNIGSSKNWADANCTYDGSPSSEQYPCTADGSKGLMSADEETNPLMANWSKIFLGYCDGASQAGFVKERVAVPKHGPDAFVYYRGKYILDALYDTFLSSSSSSSPQVVNMQLAKEVILSGTSAGGLSVFLHADYLNAKINAAAASSSSFTAASTSLVKVVAAPDAGFFLDFDSYNGTNVYTQNYQSVYTFQNCSSAVNAACVAHYAPLNEDWRCFMAPYTLPFIETRLFIVNSLVDSWQGDNIMALPCVPINSTYCTYDVTDDGDVAVTVPLARTNEVEYLDRFRRAMLTALDDFLLTPGSGAWLCECYRHAILDYDNYWLTNEVLAPSMTSIRDVFYAWYASLDDVKDETNQNSENSSSRRYSSRYKVGEFVRVAGTWNEQEWCA